MIGTIVNSTTTAFWESELHFATLTEAAGKTVEGRQATALLAQRDGQLELRSASDCPWAAANTRPFEFREKE